MTIYAVYADRLLFVVVYTKKVLYIELSKHSVILRVTSTLLDETKMDEHVHLPHLFSMSFR